MQAHAALGSHPSATQLSLASNAPVDGKQHAQYKRRDPEKTVLFSIVSQHLEVFLRHTRETYTRPLPKYVERELRAYLKCGQLGEGFTRVRCPSCRHEFLVGFSCKGRGLCPSCSTRRMTATAMHMATNVLPDVPVRQ
jgi:ribosomal protein S27E